LTRPGRLLLPVALLALAGCPPAGRQPAKPAPKPGALRIEVIPQPLYAGAQLSLQGEFRQLLFHLNLHNTTKQPLEVQSVELAALNADGALLSRRVLGNVMLRRRLRGVGWIVMRDRQTIAAAHRYQGRLRLPKGDTVIGPRGVVSLTHLLSIQRPGTLPALVRCVVRHTMGATTIEVRVRRHQQKTRLTLPVQGRWWVMGGHRYDEHHGSAILSSQNFAYDLGIIGANQATHSGDPKRNDSYLANGRPIVAAAAGEVVAVHDGVAENTPVGARPDWESILRQPRDVGGNHVVIRHEADEHTVYMHMRPGLKVKVGQRVRRGELLGLCGNSGNSLETHLHFQLQDGADPLKANGLPARFSDFTFFMAHVGLYVAKERSAPLPLRLFVEPGRAERAVTWKGR
jgi:hypothetical protein